MINEQVLQGNWNEIKGKIRTRWGQVSGDDLQTFNGNVDQLLGLIQRKTGEAREAVERFLDDVTANGSSAVGTAAESVRRFAHDAGDQVREGTRDAAESLQEGYDALLQGYEEAEELVRRHPSESALVCFGAGIFAGFVIGMLLRRNG